MFCMCEQKVKCIDLRQYGFGHLSIAPPDVDFEVSVIDSRGVYALIFPCRKSGPAWVDAAMKKRIDIEPTNWRKWNENRDRA